MEHVKKIQATKSKEADEMHVAKEHVHTVQHQQRCRPSQGFVCRAGRSVIGVGTLTTQLIVVDSKMPGVLDTLNLDT